MQIDTGMGRVKVIVQHGICYLLPDNADTQRVLHAYHMTARDTDRSRCGHCAGEW